MCVFCRQWVPTLQVFCFLTKYGEDDVLCLIFVLRTVNYLAKGRHPNVIAGVSVSQAYDAEVAGNALNKFYASMLLGKMTGS